MKIGDFGLATFSNKNSSDVLKDNVGTPLYQSPEQIENKPYNEKVDIYSLGIILLEMCTLFKTQSERKTVLENVRNKSIIPSSIELNYSLPYHLIKLMTQYQPDLRPDTTTIMNFLRNNKLGDDNLI